MGLKLGIDAKLYYNTGTYAAPVWVELTNVKDVTLNLERAEADVTTRANAGWRAVAQTLREASIDFEMQWDTADAGFTAIQAAFFGGTSVEILALDGASDAEGGQGLKEIRDLPDLESLFLPASAAQTGIEHLQAMKKLSKLAVFGRPDMMLTQELQAALPRCAVGQICN